MNIDDTYTDSKNLAADIYEYDLLCELEYELVTGKTELTEFSLEYRNELRAKCGFDKSELTVEQVRERIANNLVF